MNARGKILNKILANQFEQPNKRITHHDQVVFIPVVQNWLNIKKNQSIEYITLIE